jgi:hypothetical protein
LSEVSEDKKDPKIISYVTIKKFKLPCVACGIAYLGDKESVVCPCPLKKTLTAIAAPIIETIVTEQWVSIWSSDSRESNVSMNKSLKRKLNE